MNFTFAKPTEIDAAGKYRVFPQVENEIWELKFQTEPTDEEINNELTRILELRDIEAENVKQQRIIELQNELNRLSNE